MEREINPQALNEWANKVQRGLAAHNRRIGALEAKEAPRPDAVAMGLPFRVRMRSKQPLTQAQLETKMVRNGATPEEAAANAGQIFRNLYGEAAA